MSNNKVVEILTALEYALTENYRAEAVEKAIKCVKLLPELVEALERYENLATTQMDARDMLDCYLSLTDAHKDLREIAKELIE